MSVTAERQDQPKAYYEVPSLQVSKYVKRLQLLKDIETSFADSMESAFHPRRVILLGMGGQGKTQLALEYCHMARTSETYQAIFWIDAYLLLLSPKRLKQSLQRFLTRDVCSLVSSQRWNSSKTHLEGGKDRGLWYSTIMTIPIDLKNISAYLPQGQTGAILFTSRHAASERLGIVIKLSQMTEDESLELLLQQSKQERTDENNAEG